jgi:hypothetical protein
MEDADLNNEFNIQPSANAIPDLNELSLIVLELLDYIESDEMVVLEQSFLNEYIKANTLENNNDSNNTNLRKIANLRKSADKKKEEFEHLIFSKYNSKLPMKIISLMIEQDRYNNLNELLDMFDLLQNVKNGNYDINDACDKFGEKNREKYVYPKFGGKDKYFEQMSSYK